MILSLSKPKKTSNVPAVEDLDLSMFTSADIMNVVLQRSRVLHDVPRGGRAIQQWAKGDEDPLMQIVEDKGIELVRRAIRMIEQEFEPLQAEMARFSPKKVADIGCGYGFVDYFIWQSFDAELLLIDIEETPNRNFAFRMHGAGYSNLETAATFLNANGVPKGKITTLNPKTSDPALRRNIDVAISLLSCGFHYPLSTYSTFFEHSVRPGGAVIVDIGGKDMWRAKAEIDKIGYVDGGIPIPGGTTRTTIVKT